MSRQAPGYYRRIWESGELLRVAAQSVDGRDLARRLGLTPDALENGLGGLRQIGMDVPNIRGLIPFAKSLGKLGAPPAQAAAQVAPVPRAETPIRDEWDEQTNPGISEALIAAMRPVEEQVDPIEEHRLKRELRDLKDANRSLLDQVASLQDRLAILAEVRETRVDPIRPRERSSGLREGTAVVLASDWHLEEEVKPEKVQGRNAFNLEIARRRVQRFAEGARWFVESQRQVFQVRDLVLWLGGDFFTNYLHDDNIETNQLAPPAAMAFAKQSLHDVIRHQLEDPTLERIIIPCNDGNHGRMTKELRAASRTEMSLEILMYALLARDFADEPRVQFEITQGDHVYTEIYDLVVRWTHGAEVRYGGGVGGVTIPLYKAMARWETVRHAGLTCLGHFHQLTSLADLVINGSLIGYGPYSLRIGARFEVPQQAAFMVDSRRGKSISAPIWVADHDEAAA